MSFVGTSYANPYMACPDVESLRAMRYAPPGVEVREWLPLSILYEELVSDAVLRQFLDNVESFAYARWDPDYLESAHCFYTGSDPVIQTVIFAHDAWRPLEGIFWYWNTANSRTAECHDPDPFHCRFIR